MEEDVGSTVAGGGGAQAGGREGCVGAERILQAALPASQAS